METTTSQKIISVHFDGEIIVIRSEEQTYKWSVSEISEKLSKATESARNNFCISPAGYGIHWPEIDEDLSLNGLLRKDELNI